MDKATRNELNHFDVDLAKLPNVVTFVSGLIKVCSSLQYMFYLFPRTHHLPFFPGDGRCHDVSHNPSLGNMV